MLSVTYTDQYMLSQAVKIFLSTTSSWKCVLAQCWEHAHYTFCVSAADSSLSISTLTANKQFDSPTV